MAQNDIIVAKEGSGGVLAEIALAPADIGAASSTHASTHHTGGSDAIAPNNIGAAWALVLSGQTITGNTLLAAGRHRRISIGSTSAVTANVDLPHENNQAGDIVTLVGVIIGPPVIGTYTIRAASQMAGSPSAPIAYSTLATLNASGQSFTFISDGTATGWSLLPVNAHTHAASDITSGVLDFDRIQQVVDMESNVADDTDPDRFDLTANIVGGNLHVLALVQSSISLTYTSIILPELAPSAVGKVTVRCVLLGDPSDSFVQVVLPDDTAIFPASGYTEMDPDEEVTFRWNNGRWDMDIRPNPSATTAVSIFKPNATGTLALTSDFAAPPAIGNTTPAAGTFTTLTANTSLTLNGTGAAELVNGTSAAGDFRIYRTTSSANANYERGFIRWGGTSSNTLQIGMEKLGTGASRDLQLSVDGVARLTISSANGSSTFGGRVITSLPMQCPNIGSVADGDAGWVFGTTLATGLSVTSVNLRVPIVRIGGTTNLFPALKRDSTTLQVRLADDTAFAPLACGALTLNGNLDASTRDIVTDITTGTKIGTGTTQKIGFFNATPVVQQAAVADATDAASTQARLNDLLARLRTLGLIAT